MELYCLVYSLLNEKERKVKVFTEIQNAAIIADAMAESGNYTVHFIRFLYLDLN